MLLFSLLIPRFRIQVSHEARYEPILIFGLRL